MPWNENVLTSPAFRYVIEEFLNASRQHPECLECCKTESENNRYFMSFLMCNTDLAGRVEYELERPECYAGWLWQEVERVSFDRIDECKRRNEFFDIRYIQLRDHIMTKARRLAANHPGDWTPRMREAIFLGYVQGHSECVGNPRDWGLPPLQR